MAWVYLLLAGVFEVAWAMGLKSTQGFTRLWPSVYVLAMGTSSVILLGQATKHLPIGTAYAVWTGIGAIGTVLLGMILYDEPRDAARLVCMGLIIAGVIGLRVFSQN
jgi:quaternary ammonium compound-resistance protein SugE